MKKRLICIVLIGILCVSVLAGCGNDDGRKYDVYYLNIEKTALVTKSVKIESTKVDDVIEELLRYLTTDTESTEYIKPIPADVKVRDCKLDRGELKIEFSPEYNDLKGLKEVLTRSAVAKTMLQVEGVNKVSFYVSGVPLIGDDGNVTVAYTDDSFIDDYGDESGFKESKELTLYYATEDGDNLICEKKIVELDERVPLANAVLDYLRKKPETDGAKVPIPDDTKILYTSVSDGVCYVTLDSTLLTEKPDISSKAIIYSIVNSLCDSADVKSVVIKTGNINDATQKDYLDISGTYVGDRTMVVQTKTYY